MSGEGKPSEVLDRDTISPRPERPFVSDEEALRAMQRNELDIVVVWYEQLQEEVDRDPTPRSRVHAAIRLGKLQYAAGFTEMALVSLSAARGDSFQRNDAEMVDDIDILIAEYQRR